MPFQMQTDTQVHACMIELVKQNIYIILEEISLILHFWAQSLEQANTERTNMKHTHMHTFTHTANTDKPPADTGGKHAGRNKSELQPGRWGVFHTQGVAYSAQHQGSLISGRQALWPDAGTGRTEQAGPGLRAYNTNGLIVLSVVR